MRVNFGGAEGRFQRDDEAHYVVSLGENPKREDSKSVIGYEGAVTNLLNILDEEVRNCDGQLTEKLESDFSRWHLSKRKPFTKQEETLRRIVAVYNTAYYQEE